LKSSKKTKKKPRKVVEKALAKLVESFKENPDKWFDVGLNAALAYAGYEAFKDWRGALLGPVSLKLAQAGGGTPPISQIAGVAGLAFLGVSFAGSSLVNPSQRLKDALINRGVPLEEVEKYMEKHQSHFQLLDAVNLAQQFTPFGGINNLIMEFLPK